MATASFEQTFTIRALAAIWLPSAYEPRALGGRRSRRCSTTTGRRRSSSTRASTPATASTYKVTSSSPRITPEDLTGSSDEVPALDPGAATSDLPDDFSPERARTWRRTSRPAPARPTQRRWRCRTTCARSPTTSTVQSGHSDDVLEQFLFETQRGYCEQFAGAFAAMARSVGLPARVAVGFTRASPIPADPDAVPRAGRARPRLARGVPGRAGWVSFEPTPGRGMPFAEAYTGVPVAQAASGSPGGSDVAPTTTLDTSGGPIPTAPDRAPIDAGGSTRTRATATARIRRRLRPGSLPPAPRRQGGTDRRRHRPAVPHPVPGGAGRAPSPPTAAGDHARRAHRPGLDGGRRGGRPRRLPARCAATRSRSGPTAGGGRPGRRRAGPRPGAWPASSSTRPYSADGADDLAAELAEEAATARRRRRPRRQHPPGPRPALARPAASRSRPGARGRASRQRRITTTVRADLEAERQLVGSDDR